MKGDERSRSESGNGIASIKNLPSCLDELRRSNISNIFKPHLKSFEHLKPTDNVRNAACNVSHFGPFKVDTDSMHVMSLVQDLRVKRTQRGEMTRVFLDPKSDMSAPFRAPLLRPSSFSN